MWKGIASTDTNDLLKHEFRFILSREPGVYAITDGNPSVTDYFWVIWHWVTKQIGFHDKRVCKNKSQTKHSTPKKILDFQNETLSHDMS